VHGMIMVVRRDYASRSGVADAIQKLRYADARVLGFVMTRSDILSKGGKYKKYKNYKNYDYGYGYGEKKDVKEGSDG